MVKLYTKIGNIRMDTPLIAVSGIYGPDYEVLLPDRQYIGAVVTKSVTLQPRLGNPERRIVPTTAGLLNAIGLQNPGVRAFIRDEIPKLRKVEVPIIASVAGSTVKEYTECSSLLADRDEIDGIELNVSCPNAEEVGIEFGSDARSLEQLVASVRAVVNGKTLLVKLTPNVTDIVTIAEAAVCGGADVISLINTLRGMAIDLVTQKPKLGNKVGGLSGIGIHPVAVYMIRQCYISCCHRANVPIVGIGGVTNSEEVLEFMLAGATAVGIGTALFRDDGGYDVRTRVFELMATGIDDYITERGETSVGSIIGKAAPEQLFRFAEIAEFLNITETTARSLGERGLLPGSPNEGRWEITFDELESWYAGISGKEWARITTNGQVDSLSTEIDLGGGIPTERLPELMRHWQTTENVNVVKQSARSDGTAVIEIKLDELLTKSQETLESIGRKEIKTAGVGLKNRIAESVKNYLSVPFQSELTLASQKVKVSLNPNGMLRLITQDNLADLPQRDREIIRYFLATYARRIAHQLEKHTAIQ